MTTELIVSRLGGRGDGIAQGADGDIYLPFTLPGERIACAITDDKVDQIEILDPSPDRVEPPCPHFGACGGCTLQHASAKFLAAWKAELVETALAAHGLQTEIRQTLTSRIQSRRRAVFTGQRTKKTTKVGFFRRASETLIDTPDCILVEPALMDSMPALRALTKVGASRKSSISLQVTNSAAGLDVDVRNGLPLDLTLQTLLASIAAEHKLARLSWDGVMIAQIAPPHQRFGISAVLPPPHGFLQATRHGEECLQQAVLEIASSARRVADLFCGCGTFSLTLAAHAAVSAYEGDPAMVDALNDGWRKSPGLKPLQADVRDLFRRPVLAAEFAEFDAVVIDPPRAGAEAQVAEIAKSAVPIVASVSCNPATFARDAKTLCEAGFNLDWLDVVDQFLWSGHVEIVARLSR